MTRRVAITGLGLVTPIGIGNAAVWNRLHTTDSAVDTITRFDPAVFRSRMAAEINDFDPEAMLSARQARRTDRCSQLGLAAARLALADAGLDLDTIPPDRAGVLMGTALGGIGFAEGEANKFQRGGVREVDPLLALTVFGG
ncbi:MAG: beta-ketoacyl-[acyl-carrier-protein] synthase II, partial [Gemmatimonadetes bacterium HGW-Gemmatimonadetes-1]